MGDAPKKPVIEPQTFVSAVAHELKNPLSAIFGYADLLLETHIGEGLTSKQQEVITRIRQTSSKAVDLVKNYQFLALHQTSPTGSNTSIDLARIVHGVYDAYWRESDRHVQATVSIEPEPLPVAGSASHIERVVSNLLSNAMKYTPPNGSVSIVAKRVGAKVVFEVKNTGSYITPEEIAKIFSMYSRGKLAEEHNPGAGLGLFIVHTICTAIGAALTVESSEETGTTFKVEFLAA